ncbi:nucleolar RNA-binding Nop10p family protein [Candidatus Nanohalococcus occultus]|uniref:rRNA maturation protein Nop10, contains Zn-ribbon domain n=1 Tax=Candidatus Nanohalococcus occultus TaxID=2978047 RepID=A0ABY8CI20_9ARCH|nr:rRNA maturation protein Nop10, contains Zn-ribbon domain [Candidatus Nanohaloarchaeota archaeon SVXNc]
MIRKTKDGRYTMKEQLDGEKTVTARPPKFSYPDKYGEYRRKTKRQN